MVVWCKFFIGESDYINSPCWSIIRIERITTPNAHPNKLVSTFLLLYSDSIVGIKHFVIINAMYIICLIYLRNVFYCQVRWDYKSDLAFLVFILHCL